MNDTKWNELRNAMLNEMPFPPPFALKFLFEERAEGEDVLLGDVHYLGDWWCIYAIDGECFNAAFAVEWVKVRPRYLKHQGRLIVPQVIEAEDKFREILKRYSIPFEESGGVYCIYGYR